MTRLGWLDALRGLAALAVALHHAGYVFFPNVHLWLKDRFDFGTFGVLVFFLVSGYIVPASLERRGSVRGFWIGRFFRIYPLLAVAGLLAVTPFLLGVRGLRAGLEQYDPVTAVVAHVTMLQDVLGVPNAINVLWTLSYEMVFYLLIVALFVTGGHRRSAGVAAGLAAAALLAGGLLPTALLSRSAGTGPVAAAVALGLPAALAAAMSGRRALRIAGGVLGGTVAALLVVLNGRVGPWEGLAMLAVMFTGTAVYRAEHGQIRRRTAAAAAAAVCLGTLAAGVVHTGPDSGRDQLLWSGAVVLAALTFAAAWLLRDRTFPRWATGLGTVSYSLYLLHPILLAIAVQFLGFGGRDDLPGLLLFLAVLLAVSWASQRWIEAPAQRLGRRLTRRVAPRTTSGDRPEPRPDCAPRPSSPSAA
ncbi:acyltransferase family protein [Actinomadura algeriensis]|uniref:Peptidoglycan/LPS O-acetylase OafA/YrhL n=1 Tax=Actinomadura algeriensis TaxID=1679523 RepID=A0ABR9JQU3_9ACTN|nr:acyltransferase [Actinomadura algeriensis]MBE1532799.1 peptidoglycan/LPS O-acetylase OafA/YrhL [Actinomadura algeriensis]